MVFRYAETCDIDGLKCEFNDASLYDYYCGWISALDAPGKAGNALFALCIALFCAFYVVYRFKAEVFEIASEVFKIV